MFVEIDLQLACKVLFVMFKHLCVVSFLCSTFEQFITCNMCLTSFVKVCVLLQIRNLFVLCSKFPLLFPFQLPMKAFFSFPSIPLLVRVSFSVSWSSSCENWSTSSYIVSAWFNFGSPYTPVQTLLHIVKLPRLYLFQAGFFLCQFFFSSFFPFYLCSLSFSVGYVLQLRNFFPSHVLPILLDSVARAIRPGLFFPPNPLLFLRCHFSSLALFLPS